MQREARRTGLPWDPKDLIDVSTSKRTSDLSWAATEPQQDFAGLDPYLDDEHDGDEGDQDGGQDDGADNRMDL